MRRRGKTRLINRWYLLFAGVMVLFGTCNILFNSTIRETLGLSPEPVRPRAWLAARLGRSAEEGSVAIEPVPREVLEEFAQSFQTREVGKFKLPAPSVSVVSNVSSNDAASEKEKIRAAEAARGFLPWPVRIKGFGRTADGRPGAYIGKGDELCTDGRMIRSGKPANCLYRIVAVREGCVWMQALERAGADASSGLPDEIEWPDVLRIEMASLPGRPGEMRPDAVVLADADGTRVRGGDRYSVASLKGAGAEYAVRSIWRRGVCFDIFVQGGDKPACRLVCMLADRW